MAKYKVFQDSTLGYINVPENHVANIIDTYEMQRLKDVCQTGIRPLYSGATHDRFSHSMGVYYFGCRIYDAFAANTLQNFESGDALYTETKKYLDLWRHLYQYACLLHDIGHPALSHALEYLYDSAYVCIQMDTKRKKSIGSPANKEELERLIKRYKEKNDNKNSTILRNTVIKLIKERETAQNSFNELDKTPVKQHELMGAYLILTDKTIQENLINAEKDEKIKGKVLRKSKKDEYIAFIARMIIGAPYDLVDENKREMSLRNCVISLLNAKIDADSIDYLNRNSHFAGYATSKLDSARLCDGFSAYYDSNLDIFRNCMKKSSLPTIDGFVQARNFEPKWLYNHHKLVYYNEVMIKYLVKMCGQYFFVEDQEKWEELFVKYIEDCVTNGALCEFTDNRSWSYIQQRLTEYFTSRYAKTKKKSFIPIKNYLEMRTALPAKLQAEIAKHIAILESQGKAFGYLEDFRLFIIDFKNIFSKCWASFELVEFFKGFISFQYKDIIKRLNKSISELTLANITSEAKGWMNFLQSINNMFGELRTSYPNYILLPECSAELNSGGTVFNFGFSSDSHLHKLFLDFSEKYPVGSDYPEIYKKIHSGKGMDKNVLVFRHKLLTHILEEYRTRKFRKSLWKTYEEYKLFIYQLSDKTKLTPSQVEHCLHDLMESGNNIDFENVKKPSGEDKIFTNFPQGASLSATETDFNKVFGFLGDGLIIRFHKCKFKDFYDVKIQFTQYAQNVYDYGYLVKSQKEDDIFFPYIYYDEQDIDGINNEKSPKVLLEKLGNNFAGYIIDKNNEEVRSMSKNSFDAGKTIRDSVHGDIFVPNRFLSIIDCRVFQRLHRIKQLATADLIYPEAVHTRFAHSLGTFHITNLLMKHFCEILDKLNINYTQRECDIILAAALLHDVGHGPFSHAYEEISGKKMPHESWTRKIIKNDKELVEVMEKNFGPGFGDDVINCLEHKSISMGQPYNISDIFSDIISSNLDADRMDYLMRDAYNTGVKFGVIDLQKLISSMELVEKEGLPKIAIRMDAVPEIEQFIFGRYNMYSEVYFAPYKLALEALLKKICERIHYNNINRNGLIYDLFDGKITLESYLSLDDYSFIHEIRKVSETNNDEILNELIDCFMNRTGFIRRRMSNVGAVQFRSNFDDLCKSVGGINFGVLSVGKCFNAYDLSKKEILIVKNNGIVLDFSKVSKLFDEQKAQKELWKKSTQYIYYNSKVLEKELAEKKCSSMDIKKYISETERLFEKYDENKHTEIENKFDCTKEAISKAADIQQLFNNDLLADFKCDGEIKDIVQTDTYYDNENYFLAKHDFSYRCRKKDEGYIFTVKKSINNEKADKDQQFMRAEHDLPAHSDNLTESELLFKENLANALADCGGDKIKLSDLKPIIIVQNNRKSYKVCDKNLESDFCCEVSLDSITYKNIVTEESHSDYQIEIELKCKYTYRLRMNVFAEILCSLIGISLDARAKKSKYLKALSVFNMINGED